MNKFYHLALAVILSVVITFTLLSFFSSSKNNSASSPREPAYARVMETSTIRCGYAISEPWLYLDPNTKKIQGLGADVIEKLAEKLSLKIEWTEEVGWGQIGEALKSKRVDVGCSSFWIMAARARGTLSTRPFVYNPLYAYMRAGEAEGKTLRDIDQADVKVMVVDGDLSERIRAKMFPKSTAVSLVASAIPADIFMMIATKKADVAIADPFSVANFNQRSEQKLQRVGDAPLLSYGAGYPVAKGEYSLKFMMDETLGEMMISGELKAIVEKYTKAYPRSLFLPAPPYEKP